MSIMSEYGCVPGWYIRPKPKCKTTGDGLWFIYFLSSITSFALMHILCRKRTTSISLCYPQYCTIQWRSFRGPPPHNFEFHNFQRENDSQKTRVFISVRFAVVADTTSVWIFICKQWIYEMIYKGDDYFRMWLLKATLIIGQQHPMQASMDSDVSDDRLETYLLGCGGGGGADTPKNRTW
jgi:hypothetical protein